MFAPDECVFLIYRGHANQSCVYSYYKMNFSPMFFLLVPVVVRYFLYR